MEDEVVESRLGHSTDDTLLDLLLVVDERKVAVPLERSLLDELFARAMSNAKSMHSLVQAALLADQVDYLVSVPNRSICQQVDVRSDTIGGLLLRENFLKGLVDLCTAKIRLKRRDLLYGLL